eukprot:TRINITY_DN2292_c0_g1_i1.p1 TRINITY_DN2292_c0_g1~~TRINITY_DN2292_c0_g1_i1.p1  ORF type:complete len:277 (-),score=47.27 TRINITY_DN2292_c0_g1_i1:418-1248(-)
MPPLESSLGFKEDDDGLGAELGMPSVVQRLYNACKLAFVDSKDKEALGIKEIVSILDQIKPKDVGLELASADNQRGFGFFGNAAKNGRRHTLTSRWAPPITYLHLYECEEFSMGIFCLPTSAAIPLHNHPGMTVMSKLLYGTLHVRSYDWVDPFDEQLNEDPSIPRLAMMESDQVLTAPCQTEVLYPTSGGNIHAFTAITPCAILDVLSPPYCADSGRHCTYYHEAPQAAIGASRRNLEGGVREGKEDGVCLLEVYQPPDDFVVQQGRYRGQRIVP